MALTNGWRDLSLTGRSAVVTGAGRGIGRAIAHRLAGLGARTVIWDLDGALVEKTAHELRDLLEDQGRPNQISWAQVDITDRHAVVEWMRKAAASGGLDILVNNAGTTSVHATEGIRAELWNRTVSINLTGTFNCCQAAIPYIKSRLGSAIV